MLTNSVANATRNDRIVLVRLLCIFGMIYVHIPVPDTQPSLSSGGGYIQFEFLRLFLIEGYGRTSACLLSVVSGYLVSITLLSGKYPIKTFYQRRFKSIYVPMVVWGLVSVLLFFFASLSFPTFLDEECGLDRSFVASCINVVFHLSAMGEGPTMHLAFLRDLFVCMLMAPVFIYALRQAPIIVLLALSVVFIIDVESVFILRPLVALGFCVGLAIGLYKLNSDWVDRLWMLWIVLFVVMTLFIIAFNQGQWRALQWAFAEHGLDARESFLYPLSRVFGALTLWSLSAKLLTINVVRLTNKLEPYLFVAFCAHPLILVILQNSGLSVLSNTFAYQLYPVWFLLAPAVAIAAALAGTVAFSALVPGVVRTFSGDRVRNGGASLTGRAKIPASAR